MEYLFAFTALGVVVCVYAGLWVAIRLLRAIVFYITLSFCFIGLRWKIHGKVNLMPANILKALEISEADSISRRGPDFGYTIIINKWACTYSIYYYE